jgi:hypothetical protein
MAPHDKPEFVELLTQVLGFYGQAVSPFAVGVWWQACQGVELEQLRRALSAHALDPDRGRWAPKPADIVRQLVGTAADRSLVAWGKVMDAVRRVGAYQSVAFDDGAIHAAIVDMGGWPAVCRSEVDDLPFLQKRFTDLHRAYSARADTAWPARLAGDHETTNALNGRPVDPPALVGDAEKAQRVMALGVEGGTKTAVTFAESAAPHLPQPKAVAIP